MKFPTKPRWHYPPHLRHEAVVKYPSHHPQTRIRCQKPATHWNTYM